MSKSLADLFGKEEKPKTKPKAKTKKKVSKPKIPIPATTYEPTLLKEINQKLTILVNILDILTRKEDLEYKIMQIIKENDPAGWRLKQIISIVEGFYPEISQGDIKKTIRNLIEEGKIYRDKNYYLHTR